MAEIKNIVFDIYGVIICQGHNIRDILFPIFPGHKTHRYSRRVYHYYAENKIDRAEFWRLMGVESNFAKLEKNLFNKHQLDKDFYKTVNTFIKKNKKLFILSDIPHEWLNFLENKFQLTKYFSGQVYSWQQGIRKPNRKIFNILLKKYKLDPSQTLFIDDNIENIKAAKKLKMKTCWFNRENQEIKPITADFIITNFNQLINKL
jgi:putative hydrolase of the HAD superfamily